MKISITPAEADRIDDIIRRWDRVIRQSVVVATDDPSWEDASIACWEICPWLMEMEPEQTPVECLRVLRRVAVVEPVG